MSDKDNNRLLVVGKSCCGAVHCCSLSTIVYRPRDGSARSAEKRVGARGVRAVRYSLLLDLLRLLSPFHLLARRGKIWEMNLSHLCRSAPLPALAVYCYCAAIIRRAILLPRLSTRDGRSGKVPGEGREVPYCEMVCRVVFRPRRCVL